MSKRSKEITAQLPVTEIVYLADGRPVPAACVNALHDFEGVWPGASFANARAALAWSVIQAYDKIAEELSESGRSQEGL